MLKIEEKTKANIRAARWRGKNRKLASQRSAAWAKKNRKIVNERQKNNYCLEKASKRNKIYYQENKKRINENDEIRRKNLTDSYVRHLIFKEKKIDPKNIPQSLINLKKILVLIKREMKGNL